MELNIKLFSAEEQNHFNSVLDSINKSRNAEIISHPELESKIVHFYKEGRNKYIWEIENEKLEILNNKRIKGWGIIGLISLMIIITISTLVEFPNQNKLLILLYTTSIGIGILSFFNVLFIKIRWSGVKNEWRDYPCLNNIILSNKATNEDGLYQTSELTKLSKQIENSEISINKIDSDGKTLLDQTIYCISDWLPFWSVVMTEKFRDSYFPWRRPEVKDFAKSMEMLLKSNGAKCFDELSKLVKCEDCERVRSLIVTKCIYCGCETFEDLETIPISDFEEVISMK